jgi:hypothetical protein
MITEFTMYLNSRNTSKTDNEFPGYAILGSEFKSDYIF